jgi:hypothetical protein
LLALLGLLTNLVSGADDFEKSFANPPDSARPMVFWFWLNGNVTEEGITADLEAMKRVGLGGALWMWGGGINKDAPGPVKLMDPQWWNLMRHTVREADRLGLKINLSNGSGWSHSGGPWVKPRAQHAASRHEPRVPAERAIPLGIQDRPEQTSCGSNRACHLDAAALAHRGDRRGQPGSNELELVVANHWVNRLIGDAGLPKENQYTSTTHNPYKPDSPLLESGLIGPVTLQISEK